MLRKYATLQVLSASYGTPTTTFTKAAHKAEFPEVEVEPGYLYVRSRAISSRINENFDGFSAEEIKKAYKTFLHRPVFCNHHNENHRRARGVIVGVALHEDTNPDGSPDVWAETLMQIDAVNFPKMAEAIVKGEVARTSMGTDVEYSLCSFCGNKAATPAEYCKHIPRLKGKRIRRMTASGTTEDVLVAEMCYGLNFFENSLLVEEPADPTAFIIGDIIDTRGLSMSASVEIANEDEYDPFAPAPGVCPACYGDGVYSELKPDGTWTEEKTCPACKGSGKTASKGDHNVLSSFQFAHGAYPRGRDRAGINERPVLAKRSKVHGSRELESSDSGSLHGNQASKIMSFGGKRVASLHKRAWTKNHPSGMTGVPVDDYGCTKDLIDSRCPIHGAAVVNQGDYQGRGGDSKAGGRKLAVRDICPECKREVSVRQDGTIREHKSGRMTNCLGVGMKPKLAYGETIAPPQVDTMRDEECPVCGSDLFDGDQCQVCQFIKPPDMFMDPDLSAAQNADFRQDQTEEVAQAQDLQCDSCGEAFPGQQIDSAPEMADPGVNQAPAPVPQSPLDINDGTVDPMKAPNEVGDKQQQLPDPQGVGAPPQKDGQPKEPPAGGKLPKPGSEEKDQDDAKAQAPDDSKGADPNTPNPKEKDDTNSTNPFAKQDQDSDPKAKDADPKELAQVDQGHSDADPDPSGAKDPDHDGDEAKDGQAPDQGSGQDPKLKVGDPCPKCNAGTLKQINELLAQDDSNPDQGDDDQVGSTDDSAQDKTDDKEKDSDKEDPDGKDKPPWLKDKKAALELATAQSNWLVETVLVLGELAGVEL